MLTKEDRAEITALIAYVVSQVYMADVHDRGETEMTDEQLNTATKILNKLITNKDLGLSDDADLSTGGRQGNSVMVPSQRKTQIQKVLEALSATDRELLRAVFLEERDKDEICRIFQVDNEYLRVLVHRAKSRFRAELQRSLSRESSAESPNLPPQLPVIVRITARAIGVLGTPEKALRWLETPVRSLGDQTPLSLLESPEGISRVEDTLGRIEHGVW